MPNRRFEWTAVAAAFGAFACFLGLTWALAQGLLTTFDETWRARLHSVASPTLTIFMQTVTLMGSQVAVLGITAVSAFLLFRMGRRDRGILLLIVIGGAELLQFILKVQFHRQRPEPFFDTIVPGTYSFPSGHALLSLCLYCVLAWIVGARLGAPAKWAVRIAAAAPILAVGISRVYLGVHHPTDVIGGYLVAIAWIATLRFVRARISTMNK